LIDGQATHLDLAPKPAFETEVQGGADGQASALTARLGVVVIGRNEGQRLERCLGSLCGMMDRTVYVDSGSVDDSVAASRALGASVVELDRSTPFTAARARNEGFRTLLDAHPSLEYVFFVDGDCEVVAGWVETAVQFLEQHPETAVVWGLRRERYPDRSIYNLLCDIEWSSIPFGEASGCGGDSVMRVEPFRQANGFRPELICGEEPELCVRLRKAGWRIWHIDSEMTLHDAALYRFSQWWRRMTRGGYAFALGAHLHGKPPERHWVWECRRAWLWGLWIPIAILGAAILLGPWALAAFLVYPLNIVRLATHIPGCARRRWLRAGGLVVSKFPEMLGQIKFLWDRMRGVRPLIIEYK
jgi:GT2 family glycosyltransferase